MNKRWERELSYIPFISRDTILINNVYDLYIELGGGLSLVNKEGPFFIG